MSRTEDDKDSKIGVEEHLESAPAKSTVISSNHDQYIHDASDAVYGQKTQTIYAAIRQYRKGVLFSIIFSS
jgi:hypothetical protein